MKCLDGCVALITGASSGLGEEFAYQLAPIAKALILVARRNDRLEAVRERLSTEWPGCLFVVYQADLSQEVERRGLANWLREQSITVNLLINNAGVGDSGEFLTAEWERIRTMLDVNISALTHLTSLLLPSMLQAEHAAVLNVSSVAGFFPMPNTAVYAATKAYVTSFSEALAMELRPLGITVTTLCPGPVPTEFFNVAARPGEKDQPNHVDTMPFFVTTPQKVVQVGLRAVVKERPRVIPNAILAIMVGAALFIPFCLMRRVIAAFRTSL